MMLIRDSHQTHYYSKPFESLLTDALEDSKPVAKTRTLIVGTGYGGSVAAYRLSDQTAATDAQTEGQFDVMVLERGNEYALGEFPNQLADLPSHVALWRDTDASDSGNDNALFNIHTGKGVDVIVGSGLGGTSLINANVAIQPDLKIFKQSPWPKELSKTNELEAAYGHVTTLLGVANKDEDKAILRSLTKYKAFSRLSAAVNEQAEPAPIAVSLRDTTNAFGVLQSACTHCGNCVSGCNVGAKNTLAMNFIPAAAASGAVFFTGANVLSVEPIATPKTAARWKVRVVPTSKLARAKRSGVYFIEAERVILAAGTLGTSEILQRSQQLDYLECSEQLGKSFSTNGDGVALSFAENDPVNAIGSSQYATPPDNDTTRPGPTISAMMNGKVGIIGNRRSFLLEDAAVPAPLIEFFGEIITTAAQFGRLGHNRLPAWFKKEGNSHHDPLGVHRTALQHSQVFLMMSEDDSHRRTLGELTFKFDADANKSTSGHVLATWNADGDSPDPTLEKIDNKLAKHDRSEGLNKGQYVSNPLWKLLPDSASSVMSGKFPGGRLITVHPLGGCGMGDSAKTGVVDDRGRVFKRTGGLYEGLYVMDGSMIPCALGVNPFLTIAALAWRACELLAKPKQLPKANQPPRISVAAPLIPADAGQIVIREQLTGKLYDVSAEDRQKLEATYPEVKQSNESSLDDKPGASRWFGKDGLILHVESDPSFTDALLTGNRPVELTAKLWSNPVDKGRCEKHHTYGIPTKHLEGIQPVATGCGTVTLMEADAPPSGNEPILLARRKQALRAYLQRRKTKWYEEALKWIEDSGVVGDKEPIDGFFGSTLGRARGFLSIAEMQSTYRKFKYDITLQDNNGQIIKINGEKLIAWRPDNRQLWQALMELPTSVEFQQLSIRAKCDWMVDMHYLVGDGLFKIQSPQFVTKGLYNAAAFTLRLARTILQSSFWEFGAPEYPLLKIRQDAMPPDRIGDFDRIKQKELRVRKFSGKDNKSDETISIQLHRYGKQSNREPVLLLHGLAQGSLIYCHPKLPKSMASYLLDQGYDVWLLDYRISNLFKGTISFDDGWTMDELGEHDIPDAITAILKQYAQGTKLHIFAHCVGSVAIQMAILQGKVKNTQIASVALNAIHPWVAGSPYNRVRAKLGVMFRDMIRNDYLDPILQPEKDVDAMQTLMDRAAFSIARLDERPTGLPDEPPTELHDRDHDRLANGICDRMTFLYGRMWRHNNVKSIHPHWKDLVGTAPGAVYRHLYYLLSRGRLVDHEGENSYLTEGNLKNWLEIRTLFMHGEASEVFNPQSATRSAVRLHKILGEHIKNQQQTSSNATPNVVRLKRIKKYGHMDPILADEAATTSFPYIHHFFKGEFDKENSVVQNEQRSLQMDSYGPKDDDHVSAKTKPSAGLVLRSARILDGRLLVRVWVELPTMNTSPVDDIVFIGQQPTQSNRIQPSDTDTNTNTNTNANANANADGDGDGDAIEQCYWWVDVKFKTDKIGLFDIEGVSRGSKVEMFGAARFEQKLPAMLEEFMAISNGGKHAWHDEFHWSRRLAERSKGHIHDFRFIVASCCYPGTPFDRELSDTAFAGINETIKKEPFDLLFLIGDQIYADASAGIFDPISWRDRYLDRYRTLFRSKSAAAVLRSIPTHFAIDDHEIANDFAGPLNVPSFNRNPAPEDIRSRNIASGNIDAKHLKQAVKASLSYVGAARNWLGFGKQPEQLGDFWYELDDAHETGFPTFILDTRSRRERSRPGSNSIVLDVKQLQALKAWLSKHKNNPKPKFIFSGSVIAPLTRLYDQPGAWMREDGIAGYPDQLGDIVSHILDEQVQRIVFVGGDLHLSCTATMELKKENAKPVQALQIVSSGLYAPLSFANLSRDHIRWGQLSTIPLGAECAIDYRPQELHDGSPHFVAVSAEQDTDNQSCWKITARSMDENGQEKKCHIHTL